MVRNSDYFTRNRRGYFGDGVRNRYGNTFSYPKMIII